jgi:uncharacterized repeat protein (TIGR01451 family)
LCSIATCFLIASGNKDDRSSEDAFPETHNSQEGSCFTTLRKYRLMDHHRPEKSPLAEYDYSIYPLSSLLRILLSNQCWKESSAAALRSPEKSHSTDASTKTIQSLRANFVSGEKKMSRNLSTLTQTLARPGVFLNRNLTQKILLTMLIAVLAAIPLWLGLERAQSAPAGPASPSTWTAIPEVKLEGVPAEALIGESFKFRATFDNVGTDVGYGPFIDIVLPAYGKDGNVGGPCDGISISPSVGAMMVSVNGGPLPVTTHKSLTTPCGAAPATVTHPFSSSGVSPVVVPAGGQLITLELPFGSFEPAQPKIEVEITVDLHNFADVGSAGKLTIFARGGFHFGTTPLNDYSTDQPIVTDSGGPSNDNGTTPSIGSAWVEKKDVIPTVFTVSKTYLGPEGEAVSGPNFVGYYPLRYQVAVNVADQQTVTNLVVNDCLENNMSFVSLVSPTTTGYTGLVSSPCLQMTYPSITGTTSAADVVVTYEFYITQFVGNSKTPVLDPEACANTTSTNKASASGLWVPLDPRDGPTAVKVSSSAQYMLADKHIAIQKSVKVMVRKKTILVDKKDKNGKNDLPIPGDYLEYKLRFQVSDFFTFGEIEVSDLISDGQLLVQTTPATPAHLRVTDRFGTSQGDFTNADLVVEESKDECQGVKGGTRLVFNVSKAMMSLSNFVRHNQGIMTGGQAMSSVSSVPAEGEITFYVQIQDEFSHHGDKVTKYVDKHDPMNNCVVIRGRIYRNSDDKAPKPLDAVCSDDSATSLMIKPDVLRKEIIARNGKLLKKITNAPPPKFAAGDTITFSISKTIPSGDWEHITVQDWAPLPALETNSLIFPATIPICSGYPAAGQVCLGSNDNVGQPIGGMVHNADNSFTFDYGTQNNPANTPKTIEFWFTLTLTNKPYADGLFFTNEVQECEFNTFGVKFCQVAVAQFELTEPSLRITKGVVWAGSGEKPVKNNDAVFTPTPASGVAFSAPGSCPGFSPTIRSLGLVPISSDVSNVDAFDTVLFAIVVENRGSGLNGAFDIKVRDTLPVELTLVSPICVTYGDGLPIANSGPATLFTPAGLELTDPSATQGALGPYDLTPGSNGHNIAVITFYASVNKEIHAGCYTNKAELLHYATTNDGPDFVSGGFGGPFKDSANVCVLPTAEKCVTTTSEPHTKPDNSMDTSSPQPPKVAIGEIVRYHLQVKIPEGISTGFYITDYLPTDLAHLPSNMTYMKGTTKVMFISDGGLTSNAAGLKGLDGLNGKLGDKGANCLDPKPIAVLPDTLISPNPSTTTYGPGDPPSFTLGTLTNSDNDANAEYVIIEFNALVNNLPVNVSALPNKDGVTLSNSYKVFIKGAPSPAATSNNADVKILEPKLDVVKTASVQNVLPGGVILFNVDVKNNGTTDAFEVKITDPPTPGLSLSGAGTVSSTCSTPTLDPITGTVTVPTMPVGCTVTRRFEAKVTAKCPTASVTNTAYATYSSLRGNGTPIGPTNQTGSVTPGASGAVDGERQYSAQGSVTVPLICTGSLAVTKTVNNLTSVPTPTGAIFPITVSCLPSGPNTTFNLAAGGTQTVPNIPVGSTCTVTEGALPAPMPHPVCASLEWSTTPTYSPGQSVSISTAGSTVAVQVQNTYFCNTGCATPPSSMVGWWPLNEPAGATIIADIKAGHNGTPMPGGSLAAINAQSGKVGGALFITNNNVTVPDDPALKFGTSNFSIDAWFASSQPQLVGGIVDKLDVAAKKGYALYVQGNHLKLVLGNGTAFTTYTSTGSVGITSAGMTWHHVAVTVDRSSSVGTFYIDGAAAGPFTTLASSIDIATSSPLLIGGSRLPFPPTTCVCEFKVDEVEIFNSVVPPADIKSIFQADQKGKCKATISGMKFNDLNGNGIRDSGEPGLPNWTIKVTDSSGNTQTVTTDSLGNYSFTVPAPGTYTVAEVLQTGWTQTAPATPGTHTVNALPGQVVSNKDFGNRKQQNQCDLQIRKDMKPNPLVSGQQATAYITVTNVGTGPCHGPTQVAESMPPALTLVSASVPGGSCVVATGVCSYLPGIPAGGSVVFTYVFNVTAQPGTSFENCAKLKNSEDQNPANNGTCVPLTVSGSKSDLTIKKGVQCIPTAIGNVCTIALTITNNGPGAFNGFLAVQDVVTPAPSSGLSFNGPTPTGWSCSISPSNTINCASNSPVALASGQSTNLSVSVRVAGIHYKNCASVLGYTQSPFNSSTLIQETNANNNQHCVPML